MLINVWFQEKVLPWSGSRVQAVALSYFDVRVAGVAHCFRSVTHCLLDEAVPSGRGQSPEQGWTAVYPWQLVPTTAGSSRH